MYSADLSLKLNRIVEMMSFLMKCSSIHLQFWPWPDPVMRLWPSWLCSSLATKRVQDVSYIWPQSKCERRRLKRMLMTLDLNHCALSFPWQSYARICRVVINWIYCTHEFIHDSNPGLLHARPIVDEYIHSTSYTYDKHTPRVVTWGISMVKEKWKWSW